MSTKLRNCVIELDHESNIKIRISSIGEVMTGSKKNHNYKALIILEFLDGHKIY